MALQGTLDTFALPEVLRLLASANKTGRLRVGGDRGTGELWLDGGVLCAQSVGGVHGDEHEGASPMVEAVFELLRHTEGSFEFSDGDPAPGANGDVGPAGGHATVEEVLGEATERLARWHEIENVVGSPAAGVSLVVEQPEAVTVTPEQWRLLVAVGNGTTVGALGRVMAWGEYRACSEARDLVDAGLIEITAPEAGAEPDAAVGAGLAGGPEGGEAGDGGSLDVAIDDPLGADATDHRYLTADAPTPSPEHLPEPLPGSDPDQEGESHSFTHPPTDGVPDGPPAAAPTPAPEPVPAPESATGPAPANGAGNRAAADSGDALSGAPADGHDDRDDGAEAEIGDHLAGLSLEAARAVVAAADETGDDPSAEGGPTNRSGLARFIQGR